MAEEHERLVRTFRADLIHKGFRIARGSPMPDFRPDVFGERLARNGKVVEQIIVEAETEKTLFSEHTTDQLELMDEFIQFQKAKRIRVSGYLLIPRGKRFLSLARSLLGALFPEASPIRIAQL
jgi:hypothetical protein